MILPSPAGGDTTTQVGYFEVKAPEFAHWLVQGFDAGWCAHPAHVNTLDEVLIVLRPHVPMNRYLCVPVGDWTALLSNGPLGTDVGVLPRYAARELKCRAIRAVDVDDTAVYPARMLEVHTPNGDDVQERSILAMNDGGPWRFGTSGTPFPFEDQDAYTKPRKAHRFTSEMVRGYLRALGVPIDTGPDWTNAILVEQPT